MIRLFAVAVVLTLSGCSSCADRLLSDPRTLYRCQACLSDEPARCASYTDDCVKDVRWSADEKEAHKRTQEALCDTLPKPTDVNAPSCYSLPPEKMVFRCETFLARCANSLR